LQGLELYVEQFLKAQALKRFIGYHLSYQRNQHGPDMEKARENSERI
jgi:hypothetical protein